MAVNPVADVLRAVELFTEVAINDPIAGVLIALGGLFVTASVGVFAGLSLGGVVSAVFRYAETPAQQE